MRQMPIPTSNAPKLKLKTTADCDWNLEDEKKENMTLVVFYRGKHCPICKQYLTELDQRAKDFRNQGVSGLVAVSADNEEKAKAVQEEWGIKNIKIAYGLSLDAMKDWGLFISRAIKESEPDYFCEPGLFLISDGNQIYFAAINSMPFGRPHIDDVVEALKFIKAEHYPPRGTAEIDQTRDSQPDKEKKREKEEKKIEEELKESFPASDPPGNY